MISICAPFIFEEFLKDQENQYITTASYGHIEDLKKTEMSIDFENWTGIYEFTNLKIVNNIKKLSKTVDVCYLSGDNDIEGHKICESVTKILNNASYQSQALGVIICTQQIILFDTMQMQINSAKEVLDVV